MSQYDLAELGFRTETAEPSSFDCLDGKTQPTGFFRSLIESLYRAAKDDTRSSHALVKHNYQRLLDKIDSGTNDYSSMEYWRAVHNPDYRDVIQKTIVKHPLVESKMKAFKFLFLSACTVPFVSYASGSDAPQFSDYPTKISTGPFVKKLDLTQEQLQSSEKWKSFMQKELAEPVNFAGHYRVYISKNSQFLNECGNDGWACGWIIDKITGRIVSTLPLFNGNTKYHSTTDNGTPSPDALTQHTIPTQR